MPSEWKAHTGNECPVPEDTLVEVTLMNGTQSGPWPALEFYWNRDGQPDDIDFYRIVNQAEAVSTKGAPSAPERPTSHDLNPTNTSIAMTKKNAPKANDIQIAGDHYKKLPIQAWDFIAANNIGFFEGNAIKYLTRWQSKGGVEDLRKARHYIDKLIEIQEQK